MHTDVQQNAGREETAQSLASEIQARRLHTFLKGRREHLGLPQEAIAARLDISGRSYGDWERGRVKEWKDEKLYALAEALEMTEYQLTLLFLYAVGRAPQPDLRAALHRPESEDPADAAFLGDYTVMMDALSLPTFVIDQAWDVKMANKAFRDLFSGVRAHPTAMPSRNFLRFGLFHPDAPSIFIDHLKWQLAMLAQLSSSLERHSEDNGLQAIRRDVYRHAALRDAYLTDMPNWVLGTGADLVHHEGAVREVRHPDPEVGRQGCRLVEETPRSLQRLGFTRLTLVLIDVDGQWRPESCASPEHAA
ncbi:MmyB family transcriptional regulator [Streptomyces tropicalis]|uniref:Helix-turn-helix domain-containing protein n=1 Tax=Streptomyces tropicalis TaxID=3034234 RepID=A0ABT6AG25_9ACTN|nr:helix-turn-helix domain-containing protein [Streptomyces tropicalis]MDF3303321.1 helix-turn-helix domain-containing protein [Streptomyces tropicalis]